VLKNTIIKNLSLVYFMGQFGSQNLAKIENRPGTARKLPQIPTGHKKLNK
jgi:hypothetical protein